MKGSILLALAVGAALCGTANASDKAHADSAHPGHAPHWSYAGKTGASHWSELQPGFEACGIGREQSPIDIRGASPARLPELGFDYAAGAAEIVNNGHTVQVDLAQGGTLRLASGAYRLLQFHFHSPSEERVAGKAYPMVAHMVHRDDQGRIAVVAVLFKEGRENAALARVFAAMPAHEGEKASLAGGLDPAQLLPAGHGYWAFMGSLTTPPCTEGVRWQVLKDPVEVSKAQLAAPGGRRIILSPENFVLGDIVRLYFHPVSTTSRPVMLFAAEHAQELDLKVVDLFTGEHKQDAYAAVNPSQQVPVIEDGDFRLTESSAILKYLADLCNASSYPRDLKARARVNERMDWLNTGFYRSFGYDFVYPQLLPDHKRADPAVQAATLEWGREKSRRWFSILDRELIGAGKDYLCGTEPTIADFLGVCYVTLGEVIRVDLSPYPNVKRWVAAMKRRPSWDKTQQGFYQYFVGPFKDAPFVPL